MPKRADAALCQWPIDQIAAIVQLITKRARPNLENTIRDRNQPPLAPPCDFQFLARDSFSSAQR